MPGADKSSTRPGRKQPRKHASDARDFNNIGTRAVIKFSIPARQGAEGNSRHFNRNIPKEIHAILTEILACFLPGRAKDLSAPRNIVRIRPVKLPGADKSSTRPGRKQPRKHISDARDFNNIGTRAVVKVSIPARQGAEGNSRHSDRNISLFPSWSG